MVSGEDLQWGEVCNGFSVPLDFPGGGLQWWEGLQYNTGTKMEGVKILKY